MITVFSYKQWHSSSQGHLQACVEVSVQSLHDEQYSDAGATSIGVIDHRAVKVNKSLMFGQGPEGMHKKKKGRKQNSSVT